MENVSNLSDIKFEVTEKEQIVFFKFVIAEDYSQSRR